MLAIFQKGNDPYFNIASEEYLLKNFEDDIFMIYINKPSVIVGKHQNTLSEINYKYALENGISIVRRLSGGGAVYHDFGNVNFTFIRNGKEGKLVDFKGFAQPIINFLGTLGLKASFERHNSLYLNGKKISGNAEHVFKNRVLHHGTLLLSSDLERLARMLYVNTSRYNDNAVKSVRATVTNINDQLPNPLTVEEFCAKLLDFILNSSQGTRTYEFNEFDMDTIRRLVKERYSRWDWNFGYSPSYKLERRVAHKEGELAFTINVEKGKISNVTIRGKTVTDSEKEHLTTLLIGRNHDRTEIHSALIQSGITHFDLEKLVNELI